MGKVKELIEQVAKHFNVEPDAITEEMVENYCNRRKTHVVLDLHYHPDEGQDCFEGTHDECQEFIATQSPQCMYKIVPNEGN